MAFEPRKKPQESKVMKFVNLAGYVIMVNLLFLIACAPVLLLLVVFQLPAPWSYLVGVVSFLSVGPAFSGLFSAVRYMIRGDGAARGFWDGLRTNWLRMMITGAVFMGIILYFIIMVNSAYVTWVLEDNVRDMFVYGIPAMVPLMLFTALIPLNIYIDYSLTDWLKNGVNLCVKAPHWVLLGAILLWLPVVCLLWIPDIFYMIIVVFVGFWFTLSAFVSTLAMKNALIDRLLEHKDEHPELYEDETDEEEEETEEEE